jgi:glycosyl hydrolase family 79
MWTLLQRGIAALVTRVHLRSTAPTQLRSSKRQDFSSFKFLVAILADGQGPLREWMAHSPTAIRRVIAERRARILKCRTRHSRIGVILLATLIASIVESGCGGSTITPSSSTATNTPFIGPSRAVHALRASLADISIGMTPGRAVPATFMGLSHEWGTAQTMMGDSTVGVNTIYRQLISNLAAYGSGPIELRIGGGSTDETGEPTATTVQPFAEIANALGVHFYLGVNLGSDNVSLATDQANAYVSQMPVGSIDAIEIGNEPDLYAVNGMRPAPYTFQDYIADFNTWKASITPLLPTGTLLLGASWASVGMLSNIQAFDSDEGDVLAAFSQHYYLGNGAASQPADLLLMPDSATSGPEAVAAAVTTTHGFGIPFRMGETNSLYNGGAPGISNAFGSALWAVDTMFEYASEGVDGVNWHGGGTASYSPFTFLISASGATTTYTPVINPLYYGLVFFQAATGNNAQLLPVTVNTQANLTAWATVDASGTPRLVIINKDETSAGTTEVTLSGYTHASVLRLTAPSYQSTTGVTFAGQTFDGSADGTIQGTQAVETIDGDNGIFQIPMPTTSASLVVFTQ